jgi:hypothetical protein
MKLKKKKYACDRKPYTAVIDKVIDSVWFLCYDLFIRHSLHLERHEHEELSLEAQLVVSPEEPDHQDPVSRIRRLSALRCFLEGRQLAHHEGLGGHRVLPAVRAMLVDTWYPREANALLRKIGIPDLG